MRIDEPRGDGPATGVEPGEPTERVALRLERDLQRRPGPDRRDPAFPAGDDRGVRRVGSADVRRGQPADVRLRLAHPDAAGERHDLGRADDQEPGRRLVVPATVDEPERAAAHEIGPPARAASSRSSSACIGEKSRNRR